MFCTFCYGCRSALDVELSKYVGEAYPKGVCAVYCTSGKDIEGPGVDFRFAAVISAAKRSPQNFWYVVWVCIFSVVTDTCLVFSNLELVYMSILCISSIHFRSLLRFLENFGIPMRSYFIFNFWIIGLHICECLILYFPFELIMCFVGTLFIIFPQYYGVFSFYAEKFRIVLWLNPCFT